MMDTNLDLLESFINCFIIKSSGGVVTGADKSAINL